MDFKGILQQEEHFDPQDWGAFRQLAHQMMDDMVDYLQGISQQM